MNIFRKKTLDRISSPEQLTDYLRVTNPGIWLVLATVVLLLAGIFSNDREVIVAAADYLKAYGIDCLLTPIFFCAIGFFNGLGRTRFVMAQGIVSAFCVRVPVSTP